MMDLPIDRTALRGSQSRPAAFSLAGIVLVLGVAYAAGIVGVPALHNTGSPAAGWLESAYAPVCHQLEQRSLTALGHPMAVCARCTGLYAGGIVGLFMAAIWPGRRLRRLAPVWFFALIAPTVVDAALPWLGLPGLTNFPRFLSALPAGWVAGVFLGIGVLDVQKMLQERRISSANREG